MMAVSDHQNDMIQENDVHRRTFLSFLSGVAIAGSSAAAFGAEPSSIYGDQKPAPDAGKERRLLPDRLSGKHAVLGLLQMLLNPALAEIASQRGYDFLLLDGEHGVFNEQELLQAIKAVSATNVLAIVRLAKHDTKALVRYLDAGADAIVVPHVSTVEEARVLARAMPPRKGRCLIVIIESVPGVANAEAILGVDGVDGAIVGPNDLSTDMGHQGDYARPAYVEALSRIEQAASRTGKFLGTIPHGSNSLEALYARGHRLLIIGGDRSLIGDAMSAKIDQARLAIRQPE